MAALRLASALARVPQLLFGFEGRIGRLVFWAVQIPVLILFWLYGQHVDPLLARWFPYSVFEGLTFAIVLAAPLIWVQCAIVIKRCHDRGKSGFWALLLFIPVIGFVWLLIDCGLLPPARGAATTETGPTARRSGP
jgi:uncharacterized membrane protein YhaH (DUF805 family)